MIANASVKIPLGELSLYENNPRTISSTKYESLKKSLDNFGLFQPLTLNFNRKEIISGNQRNRALLEKFPADHLVDCMVPNRELTKKEEESIVLASNSTFGDFDLDVISNTFELSLGEIQELDLDIKLPEIESLPEFDIEDEDAPIDSDNKKYKLEIQLGNEMELRDLYDDLTSKGYMVKEL